MWTREDHAYQNNAEVNKSLLTSFLEEQHLCFYFFWNKPFSYLFKTELLMIITLRVLFFHQVSVIHEKMVHETFAEKILIFPSLSFSTYKQANKEKKKYILKPPKFTLSFSLLQPKTTAAMLLWIIHELYIEKDDVVLWLKKLQVIRELAYVLFTLLNLLFL